MKKFKIVSVVALACVLALMCVAFFTACGDNTFDIDTSKQATDTELKEFNEKVAAANTDIDEVTGMPVAFAGKSFKIVMDVTVSSGAQGKAQTDLTAKAEGVVNMTAKPTAKADGSLSVSMTDGGETTASEGKMSVTVTDDTAYLMIEENGEKTRIKFSLSGLGDLIDPGDVPGDVPGGDTADDTDKTVEEFLAEIKDAFADLNVTFTPELYISGGVMKVVLDENNYIGVAYDNDWHLKACDVVIKDLVVNDGGRKTTLGMTLTMRVADAETITAPSDANDYTLGSFPL